MMTPDQKGRKPRQGGRGVLSSIWNTHGKGRGSPNSWSGPIADITLQVSTAATSTSSPPQPNGDSLRRPAAQIGGIGIAPANINYATGHAIFEAT